MAATTREASATVLEIQRMSTEDGPGIRTTVFLKGCPLACAWCHNPESISPRPQVIWYEWKCIGCGSCVDACPCGALALGPAGLVVDPSRCTSCGTCVEACPTTAREQLGRTWALDDLVCEVAKDRAFFESSEGGVTVSGGEPGVQASFVAAFLERCRALGLHTAVDTCGLVGTAALLHMVERADLVLYDLKEIDPDRHVAFTGHSNRRVLANALAVRDHLRAHGGEMWVRTPLIPGATATGDNLRGLGRFIAEHLADVVGRWELCSFNNLCTDKYSRLGLSWRFADIGLLSRAEQVRYEAIARDTGVDPERVQVTGPARVERTGATS